MSSSTGLLYDAVKSLGFRVRPVPVDFSDQ
jgi:hypothetical protein